MGELLQYYRLYDTPFFLILATSALGMAYRLRLLSFRAFISKTDPQKPSAEYLRELIEVDTLIQPFYRVVCALDLSQIRLRVLPILNHRICKRNRNRN